MPNLVYLPDFDRPLRAEMRGRQIPLREQLIYTTLLGDIAVVSAASPFKNAGGFREISSLKGLIASGVIRFPLDARHKQKIARYIVSRSKRLTDAGLGLMGNPEYRAYNCEAAEDVLNTIDRSEAILVRKADCDELFRELVTADTTGNDPYSLNRLLRSKKSVWGVEDYLQFVRSRSSSGNKLFQRFDIVENAPATFVIDDVLRTEMCARLDKLFFLANARSAGISGQHTNDFSLSGAGLFRSFAQNYKIQGVSLHDRFTSLGEHELLLLRERSEMRRLAAVVLSWIGNAAHELRDMELRGASQSSLDSWLSFRSRLVTATAEMLLAELLAQALGLLVSENGGIYQPLIRLLGIFSGFLTITEYKVKKTPSYAVFALLENWRRSAHSI